MIEGTKQPVVPVAVTPQQEPPPQVQGQEGIRTDFAGAGQRGIENSVVTQSLEDYGDGYGPYAVKIGGGNAPASAQTRTRSYGGEAYPGGKFVYGKRGEIIFMPSQDTGTGTQDGASALGFARNAHRSVAPTYEGPDDDWGDGAPRNVAPLTRRARELGVHEPLEVDSNDGAGMVDLSDLTDVHRPPGRSGRFPAPPPWGRFSASPQMGRNATREVWYPWDHDCSSPTPPDQVQATLEVSANVPVSVQLTTRESPVARQGPTRQIPVSYSQRIVTGTEQARHLLAAPRNDTVGVAAAPQSQAAPTSDDHIDEPTQQFLAKWSAAIGEGPDIGNQFFMGIINKSVEAAKDTIHAGMERVLITMLGKMAEHLRMPTLEKLLKQPTDNTLDLVKEHLPDIGKVIPEKQKKELTDLLESVGIKWPKLFG